MRIHHIALFIATAILLFSCVKERPDNGNSTSEENLLTTISLDLQPERIAEPYSKSSSPITRATPLDESLISDLHVLIFRADGVIVSNDHIGNLNLKGYESNKITINTTTGNGMQIYVVANGDVNDDTEDTPLDKDLQGIATLDQLRELLVTVKGDGLNRIERLTMVGTITTNISKPHITPISIPLYYLSAKITLTLTDATPESLGIHIEGWDVVNIPKQTYLLERTSPENDAVNGSTAADYIQTEGRYSFESADLTSKKWSQTLYCFENRRGGRVNCQDPTDPANKYPGMNVNDTNQRGKSWYAPAGATCVLIYGTYTNNEQTNQVIYKIFLGANPINDYNIERGKHYQYNVTINGLNDINVDTNVEWGSASFSVDHSDNLLMDAHPDFRVFRIGGTSVDVSTAAYATVEVFEEDGVTPATWLSVSPLNLYRHGIKQPTGTQQQFGEGEGTGSYVRAKYTSDVTPESTFANSTFGMTRKLTKIPFVQPAVYQYQNIIVYADGLDTPDAIRKGEVSIRYFKGADGTEEAGKLTFKLTQTGAIKISDNLLMERYEESAMLMHPGLAAGLQRTTTMQWGYSGEMLYGDEGLRYTNGNYLTANSIYNNVQNRNGMNTPQWDGSAYSAYRAMWPQKGTQIGVPSTLGVVDNIYFYPALTAVTLPSLYFHPIFNSSAARYCHEKNRDINGDGVISESETVWYLPSFADMWFISKNLPADITLGGTYWTSSEETSTESRTYTFPAKSTAITAKSSLARVRCVRGTGVELPDATIESTETDKTKITLGSAAGVSGVFNIADATGLTWTVSSSAQEWLKVATVSNGTNAVASSTGTGNKSLYAYVATANTSTTDDRIGTLNLTRIGLSSTPDKIITVKQEKAVPASTVTPISLELKFLDGESAAFSIDNKSTGLPWTVTVNSANQGWLQIATSESGAEKASVHSGNDDAILYAYTTQGNINVGSDRKGYITFSREKQKDVTVNVIQKGRTRYIPEPHKGWAGSNVYWDNSYVNDDGTIGRLTFDDVDKMDRSLMQGVLFRQGSLVAVSGRSVVNQTAKIIYVPSGKTYSVRGIPQPIVEPADPIANGGAYDLYHIHDITKDFGDICRFITEKGWGPQSGTDRSWRMPTSAEWAEFLPCDATLSNLEIQVDDDFGLCSMVRYRSNATGTKLPFSGQRKFNEPSARPQPNKELYYQTSTAYRLSNPSAYLWIAYDKIADQSKIYIESGIPRYVPVRCVVK